MRSSGFRVQKQRSVSSVKLSLKHLRQTFAMDRALDITTDKINRCHARVACVLGPDERYPDEELAYHQMRALRVMRPYYRRESE